MDYRILVEFDKLFDKLIDYLDSLGKSIILQNAVYDLFESTIFANLINNFFSNLTEENVIAYGLSDKEVSEIEKHFFKTINDIKTDFKPLQKKINADYYTNFLLDVVKYFPNFTQYVNEIENVSDLDTINEYLILKKERFQESGKKIENHKDFVLIRGVEKYIVKYKDIPNLENEEFEKVLSDIDDKDILEYLERFSGMALKDWDIWHSYSSYFFDELVGSKISLGIIAKRLVESGFCQLVFGSNTEFWYKEDNELRKSKLEIEILDVNKFKYNTRVFPQGYPLLLLEQSIRMWYFEWKLFSEKYRSSFPYIRCFLNPCYIKKGPRTIGLYPQIKIYSNGVFSISFREISSKETFYLEPFIKNEVNLSQHNFDQILVPPELIKVNRKGLILNQPLLHILLNIKEIKAENKEINKIIEESKEIITGDFEFQVVPILLEETEQMLYLEDLIDIIKGNLFFVINPPSKKILRRKINYLTDYRAIRPSIYILEFEDQPDTSSEILRKYRNQLGKIMARVSDFSVIKNKFLGENLRVFEDYTLHINEALVLWTISKKGLESSELDPNRDNIILDKQIQVEAIDHLFMSHRRLFEISSIFTIPFENVILHLNNLLTLEELVTDCDRIGNYGEIDNLIKVAGEELHWNNIRSSIEKKLELRTLYSNEERNKFLSTFGYVLTFIFGLGSLTIFAIYVIIPFLNYFNIIKANPIEISLNGSIIILIFVSLIILILTLIFKISWMRVKNKK